MWWCCLLPKWGSSIAPIFFFFFPLSHLRAHKYTQPKLSWQLSAVCWPKEIHHKHWHPLRPVRGLYDGSGLSLILFGISLSLSALFFISVLLHPVSGCWGSSLPLIGAKADIAPQPNAHGNSSASIRPLRVISNRSNRWTFASPFCLSLSLVLSHKLLAGTHRSTWDGNPTWRLTLPTKRVTPPNKVTFVRGYYIAYTRLKYTYVIQIKTMRCCYPRYLTWSSWRKSSFSGG